MVLIDEEVQEVDEITQIITNQPRKRMLRRVKVREEKPSGVLRNSFHF